MGDALLAELFGALHGIRMVVALGYHKCCCEMDSLDALNLILNRDAHKFHAYAAVIIQIEEKWIKKKKTQNWHGNLRSIVM